MTPRGLTAAWVILPVLFVLLLGWELSAWRALATERAHAAAERVRLARDIRAREEQLVAELRGQAATVAEMQWSARGSDPGAFLNRLAELVQQKRIKVLGIEPLESQVTPQFVKSWHTVRLLAPYREVRDLTARVEGERGIVEDVRLDVPPAPPGPPGAPVAGDEVQVRLRLTTLELSPQARQILERVAAASGGAAAGSAALTLPVPPPAPAPLTRDPFVFGPGAVRVAAAPGAPAATRPPAPPPARPVIAVTGIVGYPGGHLAVVNDEILQVGDVIRGHRVEAITETTVTIREPGGASRTLALPGLDQR